jgi:hypothetical protein
MSSNRKNISILKKYFWIFAGIISLLINLFFSKFPSITEAIYSNFIFQGIRYLYDYTLGFIPFPMVYVLFCGLIFLILRHLKYLFAKSYIFSISKTLFKTASIFGFVIASFYVLWGFNYARIPFQEKQSLNVIEVDSNYVISALLHCKNKIESTYPEIDYQEINYAELEKEVRANLQKSLKRMGYLAGSKVRGRLLKPKGTLLRISTAGVYIPFVAEGHIDGGLHPSQWPFTLAHEMSHAYGFGDEGTCNFIALIACAESENKFIQYSGWMGYFRYLAANYRRINNTEYLKLRASIDPLVIADINAVNANLDKYPDIMPDLRDFIYGSYLKSQGVQGGLQSYSNIIKMMAAWEKKHGVL